MSTQRFQIDQVDFNKARPKLLYITESKFDHEWNSTLHTHLYTEMFYVTKGPWTFKFRQQKLSRKRRRPRYCQSIGIPYRAWY